MRLSLETLILILSLSINYYNSSKSKLNQSTLKQKDYRTEKSNSRRSQLINFFAGGIAGTISSSITAPLEVVKTQLQSSRIAGKSNPTEVFVNILENDGPKGLFRGLKPMLFGIIPTRAIYFWAYSTTKTVLNPRLGDTSLNHLISAFSAGITSNTITNPLWMVKTRFQIIADTTVGQTAFKNYREVILAIYKEEGVKGFFKGIMASYVGCFEGGIQWICYEKMKDFIKYDLQNIIEHKKDFLKIRSTPRDPTPLEYFVAAGVSKFIAICATYPHEVVRTRLREQASNGVFKYSGFVDCFNKILKSEGTRGLYSGLSIHLLRSVPNAAVMFLSYELVSKWLEKKSTK